MGEVGRQILARNQGLLVAVDPLGALDDVAQRLPGNGGVLVDEERFDDVFPALVDERVGDPFVHGLAPGDLQHMLLGAVLDDLNEVDIAQHAALAQDRLGHRDFVVGQGHDKFVRCVVALGEALGEAAADGHFDVVDEFLKDVGHQRRFALTQASLGRQEEIGDVLQDDPPAIGIVPTRQFHQAGHLFRRFNAHFNPTPQRVRDAIGAGLPNG